MKANDREALLAQVRVHRRLSGVERMRIAFEMSLTTRELALTRLRQQHPNWSEPELKRELLRYAFLPSQLPEPLR
jgi:hypothetical protein